MLAETAAFDGAGFYAVDFSGFIDSKDLAERVFHHFFAPFESFECLREEVPLFLYLLYNVIGI